MPAPRLRALAAAVAAALMLSACGAGGGYQRGIFTGVVVDAPAEDIESRFGKPDRVDAADPNALKWVYKKKTFDPDNQNKVDEETIVVMKKDPASGKWKGAEVQYN